MIQPINSEKAFFLSHSGTYMFKVPARMSKQAIKKAVEEEFKTKVVNVTVSVRKGKMVRASKGKRRFPIQIQRSDSRFAYVRLAKGEKLPLFDEQNQGDGKSGGSGKGGQNKEANSSTVVAPKDAAKADKAYAKLAKKAKKAEEKGKK